MKPLVLAMATLAGAAAPVTVDFDGPLDEALRAVAKQGGMSVVVDGRLERTVQVHLEGVDAEEALESLARLYELDVDRDGNVWRVRAPPTPPATPAAASPQPPLAGGLPAVPTPERRAERPPADAEVLPGVSSFGGSAVVRSGTTVESVVAAGGRVQIEPGAVVQRDVVALGGSVRVAEGALVRGDALSMGGSLTVEPGAEIEGDALAFGGSITLRDGATLHGDAISLGGRVLREGASTVQGKTLRLGGGAGGSGAPSTQTGSDTSEEPDAASSKASSTSSRSGDGALAKFLYRFALLFIAGFLAMSLAPERLRRVEETLRAAPLRSAVVGLVTLAAAVPATVLLVVTLVGIPVALLLWVALPLGIFFGIPAVANVVGAHVPVARLRSTRALLLACGLALVLGASAVPYVGPFVTFGLVAAALGAVVSSRAGRPPLGVPVPDFGAPRTEM